jgi:hypothetical protein
MLHFVLSRNEYYGGTTENEANINKAAHFLGSAHMYSMCIRFWLNRIMGE